MMSELVDPAEIERIVGVLRHPTKHWARAVSEEQTVYILHSQECKDTQDDLRDCQFSIALEAGLEDVWKYWEDLQDTPVAVRIWYGYLVPPMRKLPRSNDETNNH